MWVGSMWEWRPGGVVPTEEKHHHKGGNCLVVTAANVTLNFASHTLTGNGTGVGLLVMSGATNFRCGTDGTVTNFNIGIEDDANGAAIEGIGADSNKDTGIFVNGAIGSTIGEFGADTKC
jgi:hypothetical protein